MEISIDWIGSLFLQTTFDWYTTRFKDRNKGYYCVTITKDYVLSGL